MSDHSCQIRRRLEPAIMADITIDSGPVEAEDRLRDVPREKWCELMLARRRFVEIRFSYDCRCLVQFVNEADEMYASLGFDSAEAMICDGYGLEPAEAAIAVEWLRLNPPKDPISLDQVVKLGKQGRPKKGEEKGGNATFSLSQRNTKAHILARLDRDGYGELAAKVRAGELSANAAAVEAGFRKQRTPIEIIRKLLPKLTLDECKEIRAILDDMMRRAA